MYDEIGPHTENDITLTNYYSFSKYAGEIASKDIDRTVLRTNFFGLSRCLRRRSLTDWLYQSLSNGDKIEVFENVLFSPLSMDTLSNIINDLVNKKPTGVFNLGSRTGLSKADFAFIFAEEVRLPRKLMRRANSTLVKHLKTYRPGDMRMDSSRFETELAVPLPELIDEIKKAAKRYL